jgi:hypothetical protein
VDHRSAVSRNLIERYVLGELSPEEEAEGEEHFFSCSICAEDIRYTSRLAAGLRAETRGRIPAITVGPNDPFEEVTIRLKTPVTAPVECECRCGGEPESIVIPASPQGGLINLRVPSTAVSPGLCIVIVRDPESGVELESHQFMVERRT